MTYPERRKRGCLVEFEPETKPQPVVEMEPLNDFCRFCKQNMRSVGLYRYSNNIFDRLAGRPSIYQRLAQVGVTLVNRPASIRICRRCVNFLAKLEQVLPVYKRWIEEEKQDDASTSPTDKRDREPTPPETPRALKKLCHNPPSPGRAKVRVNTAEVSLLSYHVS